MLGVLRNIWVANGNPAAAAERDKLEICCKRSYLIWCNLFVTNSALPSVCQADTNSREG